MTTHLYLDLLKRCLVNSIYPEAEPGILHPGNRLIGVGWPPLAHTMIGLQRLDNIQFCMESILDKSIPGDVIETGVWRGGACIFMRGILKAYDITTRNVWVADSFCGLPPPDPDKYPHDAGDKTCGLLNISLEQVKSNFAKYDLLDHQVCFLQGWFKNTLPTLAVNQLALIRLDGDMYGSTTEALTHLYPKLSSGGYCIVDDYSNGPCRRAVADYRLQHKIAEEIVEVDWTGIYWKKS